MLDIGISFCVLLEVSSPHLLYLFFSRDYLSSNKCVIKVREKAGGERLSRREWCDEGSLLYWVWEGATLVAAGDTGSRLGCRLGGGWCMGPCSVPKFILFPSFLSSLPLISVSSKDRKSSVSSLSQPCAIFPGADLLPVGGGVSAPTRAGAFRGWEGWGSSVSPLW